MTAAPRCPWPLVRHLDDRVECLTGDCGAPEEEHDAVVLVCVEIDGRCCGAGRSDR